jgi:hemolysin activation/secretion protein
MPVSGARQKGPARSAACGVALSLAIIGGVNANAQNQPSGDSLPRSRTGADAEQPAFPKFPEPASGLPAAAAPPAPVTASSGTMQLSDVQVRTADGADGAFAMAGWRPLSDSSAELKLSYTPGEPLNAIWIRRQFADNGLIGTTVGYDRIGALVQLINLALVQNGYVNSGILIEPGSDTILNLRLVAGHLVEEKPGDEGIVVIWKGKSGNGLESGYIRNRMASAQDVPLNLTAIESDFRLLADDPAIRSVNADLRPGARPGEATLAVTVDPQSRGDLYISFANNRSPSVGGERFGVGGYLRSLIRPGDTVSAEYGTTKGLNDFTASYVLPLFGPKLAFRARGGFNEAAVVETALLPLDISSKEWSAEGGFLYRILAKPLLPGAISGTWRAAQDASLGLFVEHRQVKSRLLGQPFSFSPGSVNGRTETTTLHLTGDYTRRTQRAVIALSLTGTRGLKGTRSSVPGLLSPDRHFTSGLLQANVARRLTKNRLELRFRFAGQIADGLLYSPERFSVGGTDTVRGYRENLVLADEAAVASLELAQPFTISGSSAETYAPGRFTVSTFIDGAVTHNRAGVATVPKHFGSAGGSLLWTPARWLSARATYAKAFDKVRTPGKRDIQDRGFSFRLVIHPLALLGLQK